MSAQAPQVEVPQVVVESRAAEAVVREPYLWEKVRARADNWLLARSGKRVMGWVTKGVPAHAPLSFRPRFSSSPPRLCETFKAAHVRAPLPHRRP